MIIRKVVFPHNLHDCFYSVLFPAFFSAFFQAFLLSLFVDMAARPSGGGRK